MFLGHNGNSLPKTLGVSLPLDDSKPNLFLRLKSTFFLGILLCFGWVNLACCHAQDPAGLEQGIKPYGSYHGGDLDSISMVNGGLTLHIPLASMPQRGGKLSMTFSISYNTPSLLPQGHVVCPNLNELSACYTDDVTYQLEMPPSQFGGAFGSANYGIQIIPDFYPILYPDLHSVGIPCNTSGATPPPGGCPGALSLVDYVLTDADGAGHHLGPTQGNGGNTWFARDASGYALNLSTAKYTDKAGIQYQGTSTPVSSSSNIVLPAICCGPPKTIEDPNGNKITSVYAPSTIPGDAAGATYVTGWTDTMGRFVPLPVANTGTGVATGTTDFTNCTGAMPTTSAYLWTVPGPNGGTSQFKVCYAAFP